MGKRSRESLGETSAQAYNGEKTKKRRKDGDGSEKKRNKRLRELKKDIADLPEADAEDVAEKEAVVSGGDAVNGKGEGEVLSKKAEKKRRKKERAEREAQEVNGGEEKIVADEDESKSKEGKKSKKSKKKAKKAAAAAAEEEEEEDGGVKVTEQESPKNGAPAEEGADEEGENEAGKKGKAPRFIVFVGMFSPPVCPFSLESHNFLTPSFSLQVTSPTLPQPNPSERTSPR